MKKAFIIVPFALLLAGCAGEAAPEPEIAAPVQVAVANRETIKHIVVADGSLFPVDQANVMPKITAPVARFYVNRGDHVRKGQLIARLENRDLVAAAAAAKAQAQEAEANLHTTTSATVPEAEVKAKTDVEAAQHQIDAAKKLLDSRRDLFKQGALARKLVDEAEVAYAQAKAQLQTAQEHLRGLQSVGNRAQIEAARAQLAAAKAQAQSAEAQVTYSEVRSPIDGVVADRPLYAGDMASTGQPLATVVDISRIVARVNVPQADAAAVRVGAPATIELVSGGGAISGKVTVVSPSTDANSTTVQVWVEASNRGEQFKPGASVRASIVASTIPDATVVPASALVESPKGETVVWTVSNGVARENVVATGVHEGDKVQITKGVSSGEMVVTTGALGLDDGAKVRIVQPGTKPAAGERSGK